MKLCQVILVTKREYPELYNPPVSLFPERFRDMFRRWGDNFLVAGADDDHAGDSTAGEATVVLGDSDAGILDLTGTCFASKL